MNKKDFARQLRRRSTDAERRLWYHLRDRRFSGFKFRRQAPLGDYMVDFICHERGLVIELDGGRHAARRVYDARRDAWLREQGLRVLRFPDNLIFKETHTLLDVIWQALHEAPISG